MIKAWCYSCNSYAPSLEFLPYEFFDDGSRFPNISKYCIRCMNVMWDFRKELQNRKEKLEKFNGTTTINPR